MALLQRLLQAGEGPQRKRAPEAAGFCARQGDHGAASGFIMLSRTLRARRVGLRL
jgi:hypothetical protein